MPALCGKILKMQKKKKTGKGIILSWEFIQMGTNGEAVINIVNVLDFIFPFEFMAKRGKGGKVLKNIKCFSLLVSVNGAFCQNFIVLAHQRNNKIQVKNYFICSK